MSEEGRDNSVSLTSTLCEDRDVIASSSWFIVRLQSVVTIGNVNEQKTTLMCCWAGTWDLFYKRRCTVQRAVPICTPRVLHHCHLLARLPLAHLPSLPAVVQVLRS